MKLADLKKPLPSIHWRSQSMNREGTAAMALAYMDARDVMDRLDAVCGPENWQDSYVESAKGRVICTISILIGDQWVSKSDGAGDTAVEGEKGGISDAFKRAAVKWGIGRYLYDMGAPWADCESYEKNGKRYFKKWTPSGLKKLAAIHPAAPQEETPEQDATAPDKPLMVPLCSDVDVTRITELAEAAGVSLDVIKESYLVDDIAKLNATQALKTINNLKKRIDDK